MAILSAILKHSLSGLLALSGAPAAQTAQQTAVIAACSVHLNYSAPEATAFYNEITVEKSARGSFFMACGFQSGYFGMQELPNGKKVVIFSVWDNGDFDGTKGAVPKDKQVEVLYKADDVLARRFGGEGTGEQSFFNYDWQEGKHYRFLVKAVAVNGKPSFAAYFFVPETKSWKHLATFHTFHNDNHVTDYDSFVEDFRRDTKSVGETRRAVFGNGAVLDASGAWHALTQARFGASEAASEAREKINAGATANGFFLQNGGDTRMQTKVHTRMKRDAATAALPTDLPKD